MAVKALIFGTDEMFPKLQPHYAKQVEQGNMEIIGYADPAQDNLTIYSTPDFNNLAGGGALTLPLSPQGVCFMTE